MTKRTKATPNDQQWNEGKQRCWELLSDLVGGEHHMGNVWHCGKGLRMTTFRDFATYDSNLLTRLVLLAHDRLCRCGVANGGPRHIAIEVWPRKATGDFCTRHPGLSELIAQCRQMEGGGQ